MRFQTLSLLGRSLDSGDRMSGASDRHSVSSQAYRATLPRGLRMFSKFYETSATTHQTIPKQTTTRRLRKKPGTNLATASWRKRKSPDQPFFHMESHAQSHESSLHFSQEVFENERTTTDQLPSNWRTTSRTLQNFATRMPVTTTAWQ